MPCRGKLQARRGPRPRRDARSSHTLRPAAHRPSPVATCCATSLATPLAVCSQNPAVPDKSTSSNSHSMRAHEWASCVGRRRSMLMGGRAGRSADLSTVHASLGRLRHVQHPRQQRVPRPVAQPPARQEVQLHEVIEACQLAALPCPRQGRQASTPLWWWGTHALPAADPDPPAHQ